HEVAVEPAAQFVHERRDRLQHDRPDRDRLDEVPVADVEVEDPGAGAHDELELLAEAREVGRVDRGLDLATLHPLAPAHAGDLRRAMKNPDVRWTCGSVSRNSGRLGWRKAG